MPDASPDPTSETPPKKRRWLLRYSLRSLLIFILLVNSACLLWMHWEPWTLEITLKGHTGGVRCAAFSPNGKKVVTGSYDRPASVAVWDVFTGERLMFLKPGGGWVIHLNYSTDGKHIFATTQGHNGITAEYAWDAEAGIEIENAFLFPGSRKRWRSTTTHDGTRFASGDRSGVVTVREFPPASKHNVDGKILYAWRAHDAAVLSLHFSPEGKRLVTAGKDGLAKIWRYRHPEQWWGVFTLPAFWATALLSIALAWSLLRDRRILRQ